MFVLLCIKSTFRAHFQSQILKHRLLLHCTVDCRSLRRLQPFLGFLCVYWLHVVKKLKTEFVHCVHLDLEGTVDVL